MKRRFLIGLLLVALTAFYGCKNDDDGYSLGKFWVTTATIEKGAISP